MENKALLKVILAFISIGVSIYLSFLLKLLIPRYQQQVKYFNVQNTLQS